MQQSVRGGWSWAFGGMERVKTAREEQTGFGLTGTAASEFVRQALLTWTQQWPFTLLFAEVIPSALHWVFRGSLFSGASLRQRRARVEMRKCVTGLVCERAVKRRSAAPSGCQQRFNALLSLYFQWHVLDSDSASVQPHICLCCLFIGVVYNLCDDCKRTVLHLSWRCSKILLSYFQNLTSGPFRCILCIMFLFVMVVINSQVLIFKASALSLVFFFYPIILNSPLGALWRLQLGYLKGFNCFSHKQLHTSLIYDYF